MDFAGAIKTGFQKYARFDGVSSRAEFWYWRLFVSLVIFGTTFMPLIGNIATLALVVPDLAISVRRSRDSGFSAWLLSLWIVPTMVFVWKFPDILVAASSMKIDPQTASDAEVEKYLMLLAPQLEPVIWSVLAVAAFFMVTWVLPTKTKEAGNKLVK